jgi:CheY-like chemotaxis protein
MAIDLAYEWRPDLILLDVMMPGLDGPATLKRMRDGALIKEIPVIFLTAKMLPQEVANFLRLGAIGVIGKPFDPLRLGDDLLSMWNGASSSRTITATQTVPEDVTGEVASLSHSFLHRTGVDVMRLREMAERVRAGEWSALKDVERVAHAVHGAGAMFGFPQLSAVAGAIERLAEQSASDTGPIGHMCEASIRLLSSSIEQLAENLEAARRAVPVNDCLLQGRAVGK